MPRQIRILGKVFDINYIPHLKDKEDGEELYGEMHHREFKIDINGIKPRKIQEDTLFHEAIHAALDVAGLNSMLDEKLEEAIVTCLENAFADCIDIYQLSIDNQGTPGV